VPREDGAARALGVVAALAFGAVIAATGGHPLASHPPPAVRAAAFDYPWVDRSAGAVGAFRYWSAWLLYGAHQVGHWALVWVASRRKGGGQAPARRRSAAGAHAAGDGPGGPTVGRPSSAAPAAPPPTDAHSLCWWHVATLAHHAAFCAARVAHTRWVSYNGLARDVHELTSLSAVAALLVWVWLLRSPTRGVCGGASLPLPGGRRAAAALHRAAVATHGYFFSWAAVYTLWYHPAVATPAHVTGFVYLALLLVQSGIAGTAAHVAGGWVTALEVGVAVHAAATAAAAPVRAGGRSLVPLFGWGFATTFVAVHLHGGGRRRSTRAGVTAAYVAAAAAAVGTGWGGTRPYHIVAIAVVDYAMLAVLVVVLGGGAAVAAWVDAWRCAGGGVAAREARAVDGPRGRYR